MGVAICALVVVAECEEELIKKLNRWKTKVMISGESQKVVKYTGRWPYGVCGRGVGRNSVHCTNCQKWCQRSVVV